MRLWDRRREVPVAAFVYYLAKRGVDSEGPHIAFQLNSIYKCYVQDCPRVQSSTQRLRPEPPHKVSLTTYVQYKSRQPISYLPISPHQTAPDKRPFKRTRFR
jgi:hypothetical protein